MDLSYNPSLVALDIYKSRNFIYGFESVISLWIINDLQK